MSENSGPLSDKTVAERLSKFNARTTEASKRIIATDIDRMVENVSDPVPNLRYGSVRDRVDSSESRFSLGPEAHRVYDNLEGRVVKWPRCDKANREGGHMSTIDQMAAMGCDVKYVTRKSDGAMVYEGENVAVSIPKEWQDDVDAYDVSRTKEWESDYSKDHLPYDERQHSKDQDYIEGKMRNLQSEAYAAGTLGPRSDTRGDYETVIRARGWTAQDIDRMETEARRGGRSVTEVVDTEDPERGLKGRGRMHAIGAGFDKNGRVVR